jgi:hypothetical protein
METQDSVDLAARFILRRLLTCDRESTTAVETVRAEDTMRLEDAHRAIPGRLEEVDIEQKRTNVQIREGLEALQEKADRSASSDDRIQIGLVDQDKTMRSIEADILQMKDGMEKAKKAKPISNASNGFNASLSALDVMSRVFALAVSGVMVASARDMARQAREISTISTQGGIHTPGIHTTNHPMAANAERFVKTYTKPGKNNGSLSPHLIQVSAVPASILSFIVRIEELRPDYDAQEPQFMPDGRWLPPTKKCGYQTGKSYLFQWVNDSIAPFRNNSLIGGCKPEDLKQYSAATVFTQGPDTPHLLAVEFDARLLDVATHSSGWTSLNFEHETKKDNKSTFSYLTTTGSQPRLAAPGPNNQVPQLLPKIYDFRWVDDVHGQPILPVRTHAGLIGSLPLLIALAAFSAPGGCIATVLNNYIEVGKWRPHSFQYPSGRMFTTAVHAPIHQDPANL